MVNDHKPDPNNPESFAKYIIGNVVSDFKAGIRPREVTHDFVRRWKEANKIKNLKSDLNNL
jgi:hypothetical protein